MRRVHKRPAASAGSPASVAASVAASVIVVAETMEELCLEPNAHQVVLLPLDAFVRSNLSTFRHVSDVWKLFEVDAPRVRMTVHGNVATPQNARMFLHFFVHEDVQFIVASLFCQCLFGDVYDALQRKLLREKRYLAELEEKRSARVAARVSDDRTQIFVHVHKTMRVVSLLPTGECATHFFVEIEYDVTVPNERRAKWNAKDVVLSLRTWSALKKTRLRQQ